MLAGRGDALAPVESGARPLPGDTLMGYPWEGIPPRGTQHMRRIALLTSTSTVYATRGMTCAHCERAVIEEVAAVTGVRA